MLADAFGPVDWAAVFVPRTPVLEIVLRGTLVYLALFTLLRVVLKRQSSGVSITDLLVIVLIADAAQNAMSADYKSVPEGVILVGTIVFWSYALDWATYHSPWFDRLITPTPLELIRDGQILKENLRHELMTVGELMTQLREQGVSEVGEVLVARMEPDGRVSVIKREASDEPPKPPKAVPGAG